ncbi:hypothetical protein RclHR1_19900002 [Rhizophagus clarus]|uniref:Uncharacterized protein n=1 Tax=Rhizophagus clarus TaxID=94130 RepID=A0A2Z6R5M2_9GLOM|nr:hypothetical protein RclHR1_19900002 [Rhizophagus clarus]GES98033.1 hypothetical protein GLOIN_2v1522666 [Rhizophagus clarus]
MNTTMNNKHTLQNNLSNCIYESKSDTPSQICEIDDTVTHSNNVATSDQQPQPISDVITNDNFTTSPNHNYQQYTVSNNIPHHNYWQSNTNNNTSSQFYPRNFNQNPQNPPQFNVFPPLNSFNITINSPQTNIIIIPASNPDINIKFETFYSSQT